MMLQDQSVLLERDSLHIDDVGFEDSDVSFVVSEVVGGEIILEDRDGPQSTFSQADIDAGRVFFSPVNGTTNEAETHFEFTVTDGISALFTGQKFNIQIEGSSGTAEFYGVLLDEDDTSSMYGLSGQWMARGSQLEVMETFGPLSPSADLSRAASGGAAVPEVGGQAAMDAMHHCREPN